MNIRAYLERIKYDGPLDPAADTLRKLHRAHMLAVPFENLDIHISRPIVLNQENLLRKIVDSRRGGFCYELNGAFSALLGELGFSVKKLSAEVAREEGGFGHPFDHMALMVELEDRWLADVGFGDSFIEPLLLDEAGEQVQSNGGFRIVGGEDDLLIMERRVKSEWKPQYRFTLRDYQFDDYAEMCRYHQSSQESPFTQRRTISRATTNGRITLTGTRLITTTGDERAEEQISGVSEYAEVLKDRFGVELPIEDLTALYTQG